MLGNVLSGGVVRSSGWHQCHRHPDPRSSLTPNGNGSDRSCRHSGQRPGGRASGILWVVRTRASWRDMPLEFGKWETAYKRYKLWQDTGL